MNPKEVHEKIKKLGLKSGRIGGTGTMRMKTKKRRKPKKEPEIVEVNTEEIPDIESFDTSSFDQEIANLESQLEEIVPTVTI